MKSVKRKKKSDIEMNLLSADYTLVYRYVLSICGNEQDAQDITQETFLKAMKNPEKFSGQCRESTWLCTIAKNLYIDRIRQSKRTSELEENIPDRGASIEERIADEDTAMQIHRILHSMGEPYKEVFSLRVFGQLSFAKIAQLFSKTESWARVTYHRARKSIIEELRKDGLL